MAVIHHFLTSSWLPSPEPPHKQHFTFQNLQSSLHKLTITASSTKNPRIKTSTSKSVKSNVELYNELQQFVSMTGLPQDHVPSYKELSHHGRKDLANIVRRRGYKFIAELLGNSANASKDHNREESELLVQNLDCSSSSALLERASKFIKDGELDNVDDEDDINVDHGPSCVNGIDEEIELDYSGKHISNDEVSGDDDLSKTRASTLRSVFPLEAHSDGSLSADGYHPLPHKDLDVQSGETNEEELDRLKAMLHQREKELHQLKDHIEKEKLALSALKAKAEKEIEKAQKLVLSKDNDLQNAAESLSGLEEVQIEYLGQGETVEVTGSFNGWHDRIKMDSQPLPMSLRPTEPRNSRLWSTVLWLYPGTYEIKFVVDGQWVTDSRMESVHRGAIHNNVLRVGI